MVTFLWIRCSESHPLNAPASGNDVLEGYWMLSNYLDSILVHQNIQRWTQDNTLVPWAFALQIQSDSVFYVGSFAVKKATSIIQTADGYALSISDQDDILDISYEPRTERLTVIGPDALRNQIYRKATATERGLIGELSNTNFSSDITTRFKQYFTDSLIVGTYRILPDRTQRVIFKSNGAVQGIENFNSFNIHDYFGTYHPQSGYNSIYLEDTTVVAMHNGPPFNGRVYAWSIRMDTLRLTEMLTENGERYSLGAEVMILVRE